MSKPDDKPSFFDPSDEANSWPPKDSYEPDDETEGESSSSDSPSFDYIDSVLSDRSATEGRKEEPNNPAITEEDFLVPINKREELVEEETTAAEQANPRNEELETLTANDDEGILDETSTTMEDVIEAPIEETVIETIPREEVTSNSDNFNIDDLFETTGEGQVNATTESGGTKPYYIDEEEETKPFRTFASYEYTETETPEETEDTGSTISNILSKVNRNVLILAAAVIAFGIYFLVTTISKRSYDQMGQGRTRSPRREKRVPQELRTGQRIPVWEISSQKTISSARDAQIAKAIFESSGRDNPFAIPDSILADYRKAAEIAAVKQQEPNTYKRKAYRATLVGVLTSKDSTVALIDVQEAAFDIVEGTGKTKILQLATKAMDKSKKNTQEMVVGSYVGPWAVTKIDSAKNTYSEAKVTIEYGTQRKVLNMGKSEELGIFDEQGNVDNLENPVENVGLDDFSW